MSATALAYATRGDRPDRSRQLTRAERSDETAELMTALAAASDQAEAERLRERIVLINVRVAEAVAARYERRGVPTEDLQQVAYEGLVKAVIRFDPTLRNDFLTFAVPTIRGELQRHFRDRGWTVRLPRRLQEIQWRAARVTDALSHELGRAPAPAEIATAIEVSIEDYHAAMAANGCFQPTSLDTRTGTETGTQSIGDLLPDEEPDRHYQAVEAKTALGPILRDLPERDRRILYLRYFEDRTQYEIGQDIGVTQMQVSRLLERILRDLRSDFEREPVPAPRSGS
jgi:RNA polymerase sigma-B factor